MAQIQGIQGRSRSKLLRALGNVDAAGVKPKAMGYSARVRWQINIGLSAFGVVFPQGKQNGVLLVVLYITDVSVVNSL
jgi:hypothetical protein